MSSTKSTLELPPPEEGAREGLAHRAIDNYAQRYGQCAAAETSVEKAMEYEVAGDLGMATFLFEKGIRCREREVRQRIDNGEPHRDANETLLQDHRAYFDFLCRNHHYPAILSEAADYKSIYPVTLRGDYERQQHILANLQGLLDRQATIPEGYLPEVELLSLEAADLATTRFGQLQRVGELSEEELATQPAKGRFGDLLRDAPSIRGLLHRRN